MKTTLGARITLPDVEGMNADQQRVYDSIVTGKRGTLVGLLRAALHVPALAAPWSALGEALRFNPTLPVRLTELAIILVARATSSELEWAIHSRVALREGLPQAVVDAIRDGRAPEGLSDEEAEIYTYTAELLNAVQISDASHSAIRRRWGEEGVVVLTALTGYYMMVAMTLNAHRLPLPEGMGPELGLGGTVPEALSRIPML